MTKALSRVPRSVIYHLQMHIRRLEASMAKRQTRLDELKAVLAGMEPASAARRLRRAKSANRKARGKP